MNQTKLLVVEDNSIVSFELNQRLTDLGYTSIASAKSAKEAVETASEFLPDLVLMDIQLKGPVDGITCACQIHERFGIPIIFTTAFADDDTLERAKTAEPFGFLIKPFDERELYTTIEMALYKSSLEKKLIQHERWLFTTLNSMNDGVMATDTEGKITFMNPVAARMTGWDRRTAHLLPMQQVVSLVDDKSRRTVENPIIRMMQTEEVMEPADHTILVSRDGSRLPVESSGAPIRDENGQLSGFVMITRDISERKEAEKAIRTMNKRLVHLDKVKTDFLSTVSHELRTPIAIMHQGVSLVRDGVTGPVTESQRDLLGDTLDSLDRLTRLVTDLLDLSRIEVGRLRLRKGPVDITKTIERAYRHFQQKALKKEIRFQYSVPESEVIYADEDKVTQILNNLIGNALRYTGNGGTVAVELSSLDGYVQCSVKDTGIGIDKDHLPKLFTKFEQFGQIREGDGYKGTGLGLSITKTLVEKHHGNIWVKSKPGKGSTFSFTLKKMPYPEILVVDDDKQVSDLIGMAIDDHYTICSAYSGEEAMEMIYANNPSVIILDMKLPGMSGYEVFGRLKQDTRTSDIPIIIISAYSVDEGKLEELQKQSTIPVFEKPFKPEALVEKVMELLEE